MLQVEVGSTENEITAAHRLLRGIDLRGQIVTGDAQLAQRDLSLQIVESGGDYVWMIKDNQPQVRENIETLFATEKCARGFSPAVKAFRTAETVEKGHGRLERRTLTASSELKGYVEWASAEQVFKLECTVKRLADGKVTHEVVYGITSLTEQEASAQFIADRSHPLASREWTALSAGCDVAGGLVPSADGACRACFDCYQQSGLGSVNTLRYEQCAASTAATMRHIPRKHSASSCAPLPEFLTLHMPCISPTHLTRYNISPA